jgi:hypothetical protein
MYIRVYNTFCSIIGPAYAKNYHSISPKTRCDTNPCNRRATKIRAPQMCQQNLSRYWVHMLPFGHQSVKRIMIYVRQNVHQLNAPIKLVCFGVPFCRVWPCDKLVGSHQCVAAFVYAQSSTFIKISFVAVQWWGFSGHSIENGVIVSLKIANVLSKSCFTTKWLLVTWMAHLLITFSLSLSYKACKHDGLPIIILFPSCSQVVPKLFPS